MSFFAELKRRNVVRIGIAYVVGSWALAQVAEFAVENFGAPQWALQIFVVFLILGLPVALFLAWAFELTPEGIKRDKDVDRSRSDTAQTGRKLDFIIIGVLVFAVGFLLVDKFYLGSAANPDEVVATVGRQSIAVLPLENLSNDDDNFSDGLTEEILNVLAKNRELKVAGRTSSFAFKGKTPSAAEIGAALNVDHYLEGSVRRSGDTLRITAQLIKVADGFHVWSETYDRELAKIFDIQDEIAGAIARELHLRLAPAADRRTESIDAYVKFIEAKAAFNRQPFPTGPIQSLISEALELDPEFASAHELRAFVLWFTTGFSENAATVRQKVNETANAALVLDESLVVARVLREVSSPGLSWRRSFDAIESALHVAPTNFGLVRMHCYNLRVTGYSRESAQCGRRLVELEPLAPVAHWLLGMGLSTQGRYAEARDSYRRGFELGGDYLYLYEIGLSYLVESRFDEAIGTLERTESFLGWEPKNIRRVIESAREPESGEAFLDQWVTENVAKATTIEERIWQYVWYLAFGILDPYYQVIEVSVAAGDGEWHDADNLQNAGAMYPSTGYFRHPGYLKVGKMQGLIELWDTRGKPDMCDKIDGEWACN